MMKRHNLAAEVPNKEPDLMPLFSLFTADWPSPMSAQAHHRRIAALLQEVYEYFNQPIPQHVLLMRAGDLCRFSFEEVQWAIATYRIAPPPPGHKKVPPEPHHLIALLEPQMTEAEQAEHISANLLYLVTKWGHPNFKHAHKELLPESLAIVKEEGGWEKFCSKIAEKDLTHWSAQLRNKAASMLKRQVQQERLAQLGQVRQTAALRAKPAPKGLSAVRGIVQNMQLNMRQSPSHVE
jgi:hypothetical protein